VHRGMARTVNGRKRKLYVLFFVINWSTGKQGANSCRESHISPVCCRTGRWADRRPAAITPGTSARRLTGGRHRRRVAVALGFGGGRARQSARGAPGRRRAWGGALPLAPCDDRRATDDFPENPRRRSSGAGARISVGLGRRTGGLLYSDDAHHRRLTLQQFMSSLAWLPCARLTGRAGPRRPPGRTSTRFSTSSATANRGPPIDAANPSLRSAKGWLRAPMAIPPRVGHASRSMASSFLEPAKAGRSELLFPRLAFARAYRIWTIL